MNNLFISYDLYKPDRDYSDLYEAIKALGPEWCKVKLTVWFVRTDLDAVTARDRLWARMQAQDKLIVINASSDNGAWCNVDHSDYLKQHWV